MISTNKKIGRYAGALFLIALIPYVIGQMGILENLLYLPDYLEKIKEERQLIGIAILLKWISLTAMIAFTILVFPILRKFGNRLAIGYLALRLIEFGMLVTGSAKLLTLVSLSEKYVGNVNLNNNHLEQLTGVLLVEWEWIGFIYMFTFALHCFAFYYLLLKSNLVLKIISIAGLVASILILANVIFGILGLNIGGFYLFAPIGIIELMLGIWLLIFGFREKEHRTESR